MLIRRLFIIGFVCLSFAGHVGARRIAVYDATEPERKEKKISDLIAEQEALLEKEKFKKEKSQKSPDSKVSQTEEATGSEPKWHEALSRAELQAQEGAASVKELEQQVEDEAPQTEELLQTAHVPQNGVERHDIAEVQSLFGRDSAEEFKPEAEALQTEPSSETERVPLDQPQSHEVPSNVEVPLLFGTDFEGFEDGEEVEKHQINPQMMSFQTEESSESARAPQIEPQLNDTVSKAEIQAQVGADFVDELEAHVEAPLDEPPSKDDVYSQSEAEFVGGLEVDELEARVESPLDELPSKDEVYSQSEAEFVGGLEVDELEAQVEAPQDETHSKDEVYSQSEAEFVSDLEVQSGDEKHKMQPKRRSFGWRTFWTSVAGRIKSIRVPRIKLRGNDIASKADTQAQPEADVDELEAEVEGENHKIKIKRKTPHTEELFETEAPQTEESSEPQVHEALPKAELHAQSQADTADELDAQLQGEQHALSPQMQAPQTEVPSETADVPPFDPKSNGILSKVEVHARAGVDPVDEMGAQVQAEKHEMSPRVQTPSREELLEAQVQGEKQELSPKMKAPQTEESSKTACAPRAEPHFNDALPEAEVQAQAGVDFIKHLEEHMEGEKHHLSPEMKAPRRKEEESSETAHAPRIEPELHEALSKAELQAQDGTDFIKHLEEHLESEKHELSPQMKAPQREQTEPHLKDAFSQVDPQQQIVPEFVDAVEATAEREKHESSPETQAPQDEDQMNVQMDTPQKEEPSEAAYAPQMEAQFNDDSSQAEVQVQAGVDDADELETRQTEEPLETAHAAQIEPPSNDDPSQAEVQAKASADFIDESETEDTKMEAPWMETHQTETSSEKAHAPRIEPQINDSQASAGFVDETEEQIEAPQTKVPQTEESSETASAAQMEPKLQDALGDVFGTEFVDQLQSAKAAQAKKSSQRAKKSPETPRIPQMGPELSDALGNVFGDDFVDQIKGHAKE